MNSETILQSDLLDIVFENRNKQYGAYPLRKQYNKRLYTSLVLIVSLLLVLTSVYYIQKQSSPGDANGQGAFTIPDTVQLKKIEIPRELPAPALQKKLPNVATVTNDPPRIVPDNQVTDTTTRTVADLDDKVISDNSSGGPAASTDNQVATKTQTAGTVATAEPVAEPAVFERAEVMPEYPGGLAALIKFLGNNLQVPDDALEAGQKVRVPVKFVVNKDGVLSDVEFLTQTDNVFKKEILRVMGKMPKWKPGIQNGRTVAVYYTIPVIFDMSEN